MEKYIPSVEERKKLEDMARPLRAWLLNHYHPHATIIIDYDGIQLTENTFFIPLK